MNLNLLHILICMTLDIFLQNLNPIWDNSTYIFVLEDNAPVFNQVV